MTALLRVDKIGEGTYGIVYKAEKLVSGRTDKKVVAVKRNLTDLTATGIASVRELDVTARLKGHPFIVDLDSVSFGDPFAKNQPMSPVKIDRKMKEDRIHFVLEYVKYSGEKFFADKRCCTPLVGKILACQFLLAVQYMHARGITHRDLKPANVLVNTDAKEGPRLKLCDFGMSQVLCGAAPSTPGVSTSWYRAPEICCGSTDYTSSSDNWSAGCMLWEIFASLPYLYGVDDNDQAAFNAILAKFPTTPDEKVIRKLCRNNGVTVDSRIVPDIPTGRPSTKKLFRRRSYLEQMDLSSEYIAEFGKTPGTIEELIEVLTGLLQLDPNNRWTADQALRHKFFDHFRDYINGVQKLYPPIPPPLPVIKIIPCIERRWAVAIAFSLYNERYRFDWYRHRVIFHAIDLFDRYLEWAFTPGNAAIGAMETQHTGKLHSRADTELRFWACLYMVHKYFATMSFPSTWKEFAPKCYTSSDQSRIVDQFEVLLLEHVAKYIVYRDTLLEIIDHFPQITPTEELIRNLLLAYGQCQSWEDGSVRGLFRKLMNIESSESQLPTPTEST